jgi:U3 small nucleolar RNA-associated protein 22
MPPPATKRRKLEQSEDESEGSFAEFGEVDSADSEAAEEANGDDSDVSMGGPAGAEHVSDDEDAEESVAHKNKKAAPAASTAPAQKTPKRPAATLQDGAYTSESFKSNMFKLQVDELLEQVKPKYGKKEAPAENAMRTLKTIIESIPSRDALPVCVGTSARPHC